MSDHSNLASFPNCLGCLDEDFKSNNKRKKLKSKKQLINISINKEVNCEKNSSSLLLELGSALSPLLLDSTIFSPWYEPSLHQHSTFHKKSDYNDRVLCLTITGADDISTTLSSMFSKADVFITKHNYEGKVHIIINWYDSDSTKQDFVLLQKMFGTSKIVSELFFVTKFHPIYQSLCGIPSLQIFLNNFETVYLFSTSFKVDSPALRTPITKLIQKFGKLNSIHFDASLNCYKCTLTNIKSAFTICKFHHYNTRNFEFYACHTPTEVKSLRSKLLLHFLEGNSKKQTQLPNNNKLETLDLESIPLTMEEKCSINIRRIHAGEDKRLTIMIKNIPRNMKYQKLSQLIDIISRGRYINLHFKNNLNSSHNFGYAFITFKLPIYIIDFYYHFHNQKWRGFQSSKICRLVYAKEQVLHIVV
ncbi:hypothetical protein CANINC_002725 [Pichia inconspicua]|uniref:Mei2-like C-terminal RNA recognition motif domain-containing protein n=1 Tax=Pichia inconspicua TaxID=52247 RepID=A0A4T0X1S1_9ASCO|nr:hypothetical protein CANINC_002725 [[Candida] inconspicua]